MSGECQLNPFMEDVNLSWIFHTQKKEGQREHLKREISGKGGSSTSSPPIILSSILPQPTPLRSPGPFITSNFITSEFSFSSTPLSDPLSQNNLQSHQDRSLVAFAGAILLEGLGWLPCCRWLEQKREVETLSSLKQGLGFLHWCRVKLIHPLNEGVNKLGLKRKRGGICSGRVRNRVHRVFCLKMFIACKEKKTPKH